MKNPQHDLLVNTGFYLLESGILDFIPKETRFDMTDLIDKAMAEGWCKVGVFPVSENSWLDIGQMVEYKQVLQIFSEKGAI